MKFKNYCVIIMGDTNGAVKEIEKISDTKPNILDAKGIIIATFTSFVDVKELSAWFMMNNRSFMVFDLDQNSSGVHITKPDVHEGLFGFLSKVNENQLDSRTIEFLKTMGSVRPQKDIEDAVIEDKKETPRPLLTESDIEKMSKKEKEDLMNLIMDNGLENLTEYDKKILPLLAK
ncbi:MAG: hypothetical protein E6R13_01415 [Spirochaetes bacterium]|nr:MAG: hypothetical protein E6R13_01415 [Spirochaetota bacterium]